MASKRLNITIEEGMYQLIQDAANKLYGGNVSRYLADAGLFYAGILRGQDDVVMKWKKDGEQ